MIYSSPNMDEPLDQGDLIDDCPVVSITHNQVGRVDQSRFAVDLHRSDGVYCAGINTMMDSRDFGELVGAGEVELCLSELNLLPGCYLTTIGIINTVDGTTLDLHSNACAFSVVSDRRDLGVVYLAHAWRHQADPALLRPALRYPAARGAGR